MNYFWNYGKLALLAIFGGGLDLTLTTDNKMSVLMAPTSLSFQYYQACLKGVSSDHSFF